VGNESEVMNVLGGFNETEIEKAIAESLKMNGGEVKKEEGEK